MLSSRSPSSWAARLLTLLLPLVAYHAATAAAEDHRVVVYYQTTNADGSSGDHVSLLPLIDSGNVSVTHVLVSAVHLSAADGVHLNDFPPDNELFDDVWTDVAALQARGVVVTAMLGGAAPGSFRPLDGDDASFEVWYGPLRDFLGGYGLQGIDLDVEESMSLAGVVRLIDRLRADFGADFVITLAPVASALRGGGNLSGFDYFALEAARGDEIAFYNAQFYSGFASAASTSDYESIMDAGWPAERVVLGTVTNSADAGGFVALDTVGDVIEDLVAEYPGFGGVAGWEYFNSQPGGTSAPWEWATLVAEHMNANTSVDATSTRVRARRAVSHVWHVLRRWGRQAWELAK